MIDILNDIILWWHWIVFGLVLLLIELLTGTFFVLTLAVSALIVGIISLLMIISFNGELTLWIILSLVGIAGWYKWLLDKTTPKSGQSNYRLDTLGTVKKEIDPNLRGEVVFDNPVLGNTTWIATSDELIKEGERVKIVEVNGQLIKVRRADG